MATDFKYAAQTDLAMYYPNFSSYDTKRQVMGWTQESTLDDFGGVSNVNIWYANNTGLVTQLFQDGQELTNLTGNLTTHKTQISGVGVDTVTIWGVDDEDGFEAHDIIKVNNEYVKVVSTGTNTITITSFRSLFNTHAQAVAIDDNVYLVVDESLNDAADYGWYFYDKELDMTVMAVPSDANPNDFLMEAGTDNATHFDQMLVNASMELNNLLDARYPTPLPKVAQIDQNTASSSQSKEYDAIVIKMTCYICVANILRSEFKMEEADYYHGLVTNAERTGMADRLNAGEFKLSYEVDAKDRQGAINNKSVAGTMDIVETAGEYYGQKFDLLKIEATVTGAYGVGKVKVHYYGNDKIWGQESSEELVTGGLQTFSGLGGLLVRFQGASITDGDTWEIEVSSADRKLSNPMTSGIELTRGARGY